MYKKNFPLRHAGLDPASKGFMKGAAMELIEAIRGRRSIRRFLAEPVPERTVRELIDAAIWSPSWGNTQPWKIIVATGPKLEQFQKENKEAFLTGKTSTPDIPMPKTWPDINMARYRDVGKRLLTSLAIDRKDQDGRLEYYGRMYALFEAPALVIMTIDKAVALEYALLDAGLFLQTFCLSAHDRGLGTCIMAASVHYPDILRKHFAIPDDSVIAMGVVLGRPDNNDPVNHFERSRADVSELVQWVD